MMLVTHGHYTRGLLGLANTRASRQEVIKSLKLRSTHGQVSVIMSFQTKTHSLTRIRWPGQLVIGGDGWTRPLVSFFSDINDVMLVCTSRDTWPAGFRPKTSV